MLRRVLHGTARAAVHRLTGYSRTSGIGRRLCTKHDGGGGGARRGSARVLLFGPPGAGKGTYARVVCAALDIEHVSSGDLVRREIAENTATGRAVKEPYDRGALVPDGIVFQLVHDHVHSLDSRGRGGGGGFALDGFPRRLTQIEHLLRLLSSSGGRSLDAVIDFTLPRDVLVEKACARRVCDGCGRSYNVASIMDESRGIFMPPLLPEVPGVCDSCGGHLLQRGDDAVEIVEQRLRGFDEVTAPVLDALREEHSVPVVQIDVRGGVEHTTPLVQAAVDDLHRRMSMH